MAQRIAAQDAGAVDVGTGRFRIVRAVKNRFGAANEIERTLSRGSRSDLAHFTKADQHGGAVYVSAAQVAYIEQVPET